MASPSKSTPEAEYLAELVDEVALVQAEAKRLNRRLRNARSAIQSIENDLAALAGKVRDRLEELPETARR